MFLNNNIIIIIVVAPSKFHSTLNQSPLADSDAEDKRDHLAEVQKGGEKGREHVKRRRRSISSDYFKGKIQIRNLIIILNGKEIGLFFGEFLLGSSLVHHNITDPRLAFLDTRISPSLAITRTNKSVYYMQNFLYRI